MEIIGIIICFAPLIAAIIIFTAKDKLNFLHQILACILGLFAILPISFFQFFLPGFEDSFSSIILYSLLKSFILYGLIEELFKMVLLLPLPRKSHTPGEFIKLAFIMGLGLAAFESVVYYFSHLQSANNMGAQLLYFQIFVRILTAHIIHMTCTGLSGMFIYSCFMKSRKLSPLIWAILLHGLYDFFAGFNSGLRIFSIFVVLLSIGECRIKYMDIKKIYEEKN